ncbi:hypothetical protein [Haemophilus influenzae]|uniref:Uncharacterized protein n=1 Tax=Haemophilus influenzae TaxID=727 RepID=A0ABD6WUU2_HAEIF|nr:hypothetical protein [Haemophilus influenzae]KPH67114.1 hypothetical protein AC246_09100 [Haemophilus influenzae]MCK8793520.1 hypothetical protein [Haemophilus influenzae]MCK8823210.1 hypothetical protein [Haemophilus influenzae]MCK8848314.1 hypothetical protein [Haemophilus influenzae]MCK8930860.1 hypothetical protein [Haemophilus influenzae]
MKEFNLDSALNGEPVLLRSGRKAYIGYKTPDCYVFDSSEKIEFPLHGYIIKADNIIEVPNMFWAINGRAYKDNVDNASDIVGMWEEPKLTSEQVLEKAYQENLPLDAIGKKAFVIAKTKDGDYVMQCGEDNLYFASHETMWEFYKDPEPKSNTITVTLPKPFKPKTGEEYYFIRVKGLFLGFDIDKFEFDDSEFCINHSSTGRCFYSHEDAQAWLDAMKNALGD